MDDFDKTRIDDIRAAIGRICTRDEEATDVTFVGMNAYRLLDAYDALLDRITAQSDVAGDFMASQAKRIVDLTAELTAINKELATVTAERDKSMANTDASIQNTDHAINTLEKLIASHTWTVATPDTMPPVGSGPWMVRFQVRDRNAGVFGMWSCKDSDGYYWADEDIEDGSGEPFEGTEFAAMPLDPPQEETK